MFSTSKKKEENNRKKDKKELNSSVNFTGMVSPNMELVERADLNNLTSAKLYKLLQLKNIPNRSKLRRKVDRIVSLEGIVTYADFEIIFECPTDENIDILYKEVFRKITNTHKLKSKYSTLPKDIYLKITIQLMEILSIPSYSSRINVYPENLDDLFSMLDKIRIDYYNKLPLDNDWIRIKPSWGERMMNI